MLLFFAHRQMSEMQRGEFGVGGTNMRTDRWTDVPSVSEGPSSSRQPQEPAAPVSGGEERVYFLSRLRLNTQTLTSFSFQGIEVAFTLNFFEVFSTHRSPFRSFCAFHNERERKKCSYLHFVHHVEEMSRLVADRRRRVLAWFAMPNSEKRSVFFHAEAT